MIPQAILTKAAMIAIANGFPAQFASARELTVFNVDGNTESSRIVPLEYAIYNHDFAKALWLNKRNYYPDVPAWQYHLQNMVVSEDPIKYLGEHI